MDFQKVICMVNISKTRNDNAQHISGLVDISCVCTDIYMIAWSPSPDFAAHTWKCEDFCFSRDNPTHKFLSIQIRFICICFCCKLNEELYNIIFKWLPDSLLLHLYLRPAQMSEQIFRVCHDNPTHKNTFHFFETCVWLFTHTQF